MDRHQETFDTWNNLASVYQEKFMDLDLYNDTYDNICLAIAKQGAKLLEIGCGPGNITKYLLTKRPDFDIFGIDIASNMVELAKKNNPTANFAVMDSREIKHINQKYDGVIVGFCLPYLSPMESNELISASYDLLNDDGLLYMSFVEGDPDQSDFKTSHAGRVFFQYHLLEDLKTQLLNTKFEEIETFKVEYKTSDATFDIHTILIAKKKTAH